MGSAIMATEHLEAWLLAAAIAVMPCPRGPACDLALVRAQHYSQQSPSNKSRTDAPQGKKFDLLGPLLAEEINDLAKALRLEDQMEKKALIAALKAKVSGGTPSGISIILIRPGEGKPSVQRFEKQVGTGLVIKVTKIRTAKATEPIAVVTYVEQGKGQLITKDTIMFYGKGDEWDKLPEN
jgi:hypothetical protein